MSKIKSVKVKKEYPGVSVGINLKVDHEHVGIWTDNNLCLPLVKIKDLHKYTEFFEIEYEPEKPKLLKRPDGSLISEPENDTKVLYINESYEIIKIEYDSYYYSFSLRKERIFEISDQALAEKKAKQMEIQDTITNEIHRLNAEQGWAWKLHDRFFYFEYDAYHDEVKTEWSDNSYISGQTKMSKKTMDIILEKYTQDELKQFLEIID